MPKARRRRQGSGRGTITAPRTATKNGEAQLVAPAQAASKNGRTAEGRMNAAPPKTVSANRPALSPGLLSSQSLIFPIMVALGCWGMAFSFFVFSTDPNHVLFAGMAVLMALLWSFNVGVRIRKLQRQRTVS